MNAIRGEGEWPLLRLVVEDIQNLLSWIKGVKMVFTPRKGNEASDRIAKETFSHEIMSLSCIL